MRSDRPAGTLSRFELPLLCGLHRRVAQQFMTADGFRFNHFSRFRHRDLDLNRPLRANIFRFRRVLWRHFFSGLADARWAMGAESLTGPPVTSLTGPSSVFVYSFGPGA